MKSLSECRLYAFVDTGYLHGRSPEILAQQLCDGGADIIQLRAKQSSQEEVRRLAKAIQSITHKADVPLVINDHLSIAREVGAEFCHLGQEDFAATGFSHVSEIRNPNTDIHQSTHPPIHSSINPSVRIGLSTHSPQQAQSALKTGPDYIAVGPVYATATKPGAKPVTLKYVRWAAVNVSIPWFAIGGINLENLGDVLAAGARRICVVSAILSAQDPATACRAFKQRISSGSPSARS
jgi:thiamine-phosphate pyrophosphorylase